MSQNIRSAVVGGLAASLVVAVSLAPKLLSHPDEVSVRSASAEEAVEETTTTATTAAPTTATSGAPTTTTTTDLPTRVSNVEQRVSRLEEGTTTTTSRMHVMTPTTETTRSDCGIGSAQAKATLVDMDPGVDTRYRLGAEVINNSDKAQQLDRVVIKAVYSGVTRMFTLDVAGSVVEAEASLSFDETSGHRTALEFLRA